LKSINTRTVVIGFESGSDKIIRYLKKNMGMEDNNNALRLCKQFDFKIIGSFVIGSPIETIDDMKETFSFIKNSYIDSPSVFIATPFPGTYFWSYLVENKIIDKNFCKWELLSIYSDFTNTKKMKENIYELYDNKVLLLNKSVNIKDFMGIYLEICSYIEEFKINYHKENRAVN
ncbi:unnamed protein product, partial [marine sediment metagenome]